jgi:hypothetical protein
MKLTIDGHRFDTTKATLHIPLWYCDGVRAITGDVYRSSNGLWYVETPSQWSNYRSWRIMDPAEILDEYDRYLKDEDKEQIANAAGLDWE